MNMRDHHDIPFALPLMLFIFIGFLVSTIVFHFMDDRDEELEPESSTRVSDFS
jgi:hypothetical protein